ncbi:MAG: S-methyl-5'-thioinosine phosphorylase [Gammaproteobacteria bacterium]|nr:S-methyl-5'-thioinosine phosphorylase [Gammaproteobacteria bacterium]
MASIAIIGGTGLTSLEWLEITGSEIIHTPYGEVSSTLVYGLISGTEVAFLPRHGSGHTIPPHKINYLANMWALKEAGVEYVIAVNAVGGIPQEWPPGSLVIPDQIIDYTWGRESTYCGIGDGPVVHIDFTRPYSDVLRDKLAVAAKQAGLSVETKATYGVTQGPRLESAAEVDRLEQDGCHIIGMTGMPEAALARELGLCYASIPVVANLAAGRGEDIITMAEIERHIGEGMKKIRLLLESAIPVL